jgi:hypothetical protein
MERLSNTAFDLNAATRFGRMDLAQESVAHEAQVDFGRRHKSWGRDVRIVDVELDGMQLLASDSAEVELTVSWHRVDDTIIRATNVAQKWSQANSDWKLVDEVVKGGAAGLFPKTEANAKLDPEQRERAALQSSVDMP